MAAHQGLSKLLAIRSGGLTRLFPLIVACVLIGNLSGSATDVNPKALAFKEFTDRVKEYVTLKEKLEHGLPALKPTPDPAQTEAHRKTLAAAIQMNRQSAKRGDVFGRAENLIRGLIRADSNNRTTRDTYASMQEVPKQQPPAVNAEYPEKAALATVPPLLLKNLPMLPDGVEYRFMGRDLILRDQTSNLIVDYIHEAVPTIRK